MQLKKLRAEAEQSQRKEAAAKAVLAAAKDAAREGRALSKDERSAVERPILFPEQAQEQPAAPPAVSYLLCLGKALLHKTPGGCEENVRQPETAVLGYWLRRACRPDILLKGWYGSLQIPDVEYCL